VRTGDEGIGIAAMYVPHQDSHNKRPSCDTAAEHICGLSLTPDMPPGYPPECCRNVWKRAPQRSSGFTSVTEVNPPLA
jgi:hypothetical protein